MDRLKNNFAVHPDLVPDKKWKEWTLENLPSSKNYWVTDIDSFIRSRNGCFVIIEIKRQNAEVRTWQRLSLCIIADLLHKSEGETIQPSEINGLEFPIKIKHFCGIQEIVFEKTWFDDGKVFLNGKESSEEEIIYHLKFGAFCPDCIPENDNNGCDSNNLAA
jgi:hypothetical protein